MRLTRIGRNTVLRLALIYAGVFSASILLLFGFIYWRTGGYLARQTDDVILADVEDLTEVYAAGGTTGLVYAIADHLQEDPQGRLSYSVQDFQKSSSPTTDPGFPRTHAKRSSSGCTGWRPGGAYRAAGSA